MLVRLRNLILRFVVTSLIFLSKLVRPRFLLFLGPLFVFLGWWLLPKLRNITLRNLELCFGSDLPPNELKRLGLQSFKHAYLTLIEFLYLTHLPLRKLNELVVKVTGWESLESAMTLGKGVIGLAMHYGNWELSGAYLPWQGFPLAAVGKEQRDEFFTELAFRTRRRFGIENIPRGDKFSSSMIRALKSGKILGLLADQNGGIAGRFVPFFGVQASTVRGPALLHLKFGSPLVLVIAKRLAPFCFEIVVRPLGIPPLTGDVEKDEIAILRAMNQLYEEIIREEPSQWLWFHKRFKTRPPGESSVYH